MTASAPLDLSAIHVDISRSRGLPAELYVSEAWAREERDRLLARHWTAVMHASRVAPRSAQPVELMGLPLLVARDDGGELRVFHNVCRHRGHKLVAAECRIEGVIRCPYHSWTYALDGTLRGTPHIGGPGVHEADGFHKSSYGLKAVRTVEWLGVVFVNLSGDAPPFDECVAPLKARWEAFVGTGGFDQLSVAATHPHMQLEVQANWKLAVENYCESYHLPWIHPGLNSYSKLEDHYHIMEGAVGAGQGTLAFDFASREGISLPQFVAWPGDKHSVAEYVALYPNVLLGLQMDHVFTIILQPLSHDRTMEWVELLYVGDGASDPACTFARERTLEGWREVFAEDVDAVEGMQAGRASSAFDGGVFSPVMDNPTHHFHRWVAARMSDEK
ncbi:MAG: Rieske 2Fe-2S domain-containing protein [Gammaproteobacteria bacterium]|nr:Rieske 2Fe-2S domain-containing protein [Gammaproteobacteria bacterium]